MTDLHTHSATERVAILTDLLAGIVARIGAAIEFWALASLARGEWGDPEAFVDRQWIDLREQIQQIRAILQEDERSPSESALEQVVKLLKVSAELRETFDFLINADRVAEKELEAAIVKLAQIWQEARMRVWLLGALIPLPDPPALARDKEADYQAILDRLFDQVLAARARGNGISHFHNGKPR